LTIRILLADDHASMRQSLRALVERQAGMEVVAEAHDGQSALRLAGEFKPDVVVMDTSMKDLKGVDAVRSVISNVPGVKFLALSMHAERQFVDGMLKAGARGYLLKDHAFEELVRAIQTLAENGIYLCTGIEDQAGPRSG
jgi:DNA-binding NarL/FixJ family response regulator